MSGLGLMSDTVFVHLVRWVTNRRLCRFQEEIEPTHCLTYLTARVSPPNVTTTEDCQSDSSEKVDSSKSSVELPCANEYRSTGENARDTVDGPKTFSGHKLVDWYGPQDAANPLNWRLSKKVFVTFQICVLTTAIYSGSAIYSPAIGDVSAKFGVSEVAATLGLSLFVVGYGLGPMVWSPMSEVPFIGRSPVYITTLAIFVALQGAVVRSNSYSMLMALRFFTGFVGSPVLATGGATFADMYKPSKRAYAISVWGVAAVCGPALGPIIGGYVTEYGFIDGTFTSLWEWSMYTLMWLAAVCLAVLFFTLPETSASNILYRRAQLLRLATGDPNLLSTPELEAREISGSDIVKMCLIYPFTLNLTEPMVFFLNLYIALIYGLLFIWFESYPRVFVGIYGFTTGQLGLAFLGMLGGTLCVLPLFWWWYHKYLEPQFDDEGEILPEKRLPTACVGAFCIPICLLWFGWSSRPDVHWIVPIIGTAWFSIGTFLMFLAILNYLPDAYPKHIPSVLAGNNMFRSSFGAGFPLFAGLMYDTLGIGWASTTLAFISIAFIPIPFVLWKFGGVLRNKHSKIAMKDKR